jgi:[protein-PII] uridylyltransferase
LVEPVPDIAAPVGAGAGGLREARAALLERRRLRGRKFCTEYSDAADAWLAQLFARAGTERGVALIAVGGLGRRELAPESDLDLVLVHEGMRNISEVADAIWYPIWDAGLHLDHSVRTVKETVNVIGSDIKSALSLLTGRCVAGDARLAEHVVEEARARWRKRPRESLERLRSALEERWAQHGEFAFLLEPDVKLARGGLRDIEALQAAAAAAPVVARYLDDPRLDEAAEELLALRVALHATTKRRSDRLLLDDQDAVARRLGAADADELLPRTAAAARRISWTTDQVWRRIRSWLAGPGRARYARPVEDGIALHEDELLLDGTLSPATDSTLALRIAAASARSGIPMAPSTLERLETDATAPSEPWPRATRDALLDLLGCGPAAVPVLETLDHIGVLGRYLGEWHAVRSKPQRNVFHRYTVDRHLFETVAEASALTRTVHRPDLLLVGAWLHDIGKGFPGDHTDAGIPLMAAIARRMGFEEADVTTLANLVRDHLLLAETATGRDMSDEATIARVAERAGSVENLELLAALTEADSIATGPTSWGSWKAKLIEELVVRTRAHFAGVRQERAAPAPTGDQRALMSEGALKLIPERDRLTIVAPDRPGLLSIVAGVLAAERLSVRSAMGMSEDGMAVETYELDHTSREPNWSRIETHLVRAMRDPGSLDALLAERARPGSLPVRRGAAKLASPRVIVDNDATPRATIIEVRAPDGVGVLYRIARAIASCGGNIATVRALTLGHEVVDTFYVTDGRSGSKLTDTATLERLERAILNELRARAEPEAEPESESEPEPEPASG